MFGTVLRRRWHGGIAVSGVDTGCPQLAHQNLPTVRNGDECCQVQGHDVPDGINMVWDVRRGGGKTMHGKGGDAQRVTQKVEPLSGLRRGTHNIIDDGTQTAHAWYGYGYRLEPFTGK